jgi:carbon-monoxide dehydrogenase large subunit
MRPDDERPVHTGAPARRVEDERLITGRGRFGDDRLADAAQVHFVRSPYAHARILSIDTHDARRLDGVLAVLTFADLPIALQAPLPVLFRHPDLVRAVTPPPLARDEVCFAGQPVAVIVAVDRYTAEDAADLVDVHYKPLGVVVGVTDAPHAYHPPVHLGHDDGVAAVVSEEVGTVDEALRTAPRRLRRTFHVERSAGMPMEGRVVSAGLVGDVLRVGDTTQSPASIQAGLADLLDMAVEDVQVVAGDVGGSFGSKGVYFYPEEVVVPWLAVALRRAVKWTEDRREHFVASAHERGQQHEVTVGYDDDGRVLALETAFVHDMGAFAQYGLIVPVVTASQLPGVYRLPNYRYTFASVYTNTVPVAPYRGAGRPHGVFVIERVMDLIAEDLALDPLQVRRRNLIAPDAFPYPVGVTYQDGLPTTYDSGNYPALFDRLEQAGFEQLRTERDAGRRAGRCRGVGVAAYVEGTGLGPYESASVSVAASGRVTVAVVLSSQGQGHETMLAQVVADRMRIPMASVRVRGGDTAPGLASAGTYASRAAVLAANAAADAADAVTTAALELAGRALDVPVDRLTFDRGTVFCVDDPAQRITFGDLARIADPAAFTVGAGPGRLSTLRSFAHRPGTIAGPSALRAVRTFVSSRGAWGSGLHAVLVDVDPLTFAVTVLRYLVVHDCGVVINPGIVRGQVIGGLVQGLGGALHERFEYGEDGLLRNADLRAFHLPGAADVPEIEIHHVCTASTTNRLGVKGVGEAGAIPVPAAMANAVSDALGTAIDRVPMFASDLQRLRAGPSSRDRSQFVTTHPPTTGEPS